MARKREYNCPTDPKPPGKPLTPQDDEPGPTGPPAGPPDTDGDDDGD